MQNLSGIRPLLTLAFLVALAGCETNKVTKANYDQIQIGQSVADVEKLLGGPGQPAGSRVIGTLPGGHPLTAQTVRWKSGSTVIEIEFQKGKVAKKSAT